MAPFSVSAEPENHSDLYLSVAWVLKLLKYLQLMPWGGRGGVSSCNV